MKRAIKISFVYSKVLNLSRFSKHDRLKINKFKQSSFKEI